MKNLTGVDARFLHLRANPFPDFKFLPDPLRGAFGSFRTEVDYSAEVSRRLADVARMASDVIDHKCHGDKVMVAIMGRVPISDLAH